MASQRQNGVIPSPGVGVPTLGGRLRALWQLPLLLLSFALFGYAAYLFIDPKPPLTTAQKLDGAESLIGSGQSEAVIDEVEKLLIEGKTSAVDSARAQMLMSRAIDAFQRAKKLNLPANHSQIVAYAKAAIGMGFKADAEDYRRMGASYEALSKTDDAIRNYTAAMSAEPALESTLLKKAIELQLSKPDNAAAEVGLNELLKQPTLTDADRIWATGEKSRLLVDRGAFAEAREVLNDALKMNKGASALGAIYYRLGYCAFRLGEAAEAERLLRIARDDLKTQSPLDADAAELLGKLLQDKRDAKAYPEALAFYQDVMTSHPDSQVMPLARLGRGVCRIHLGQDAPGLEDLRQLTKDLGARASLQRYKSDIATGLRDAQMVVTDRENYQGALELMSEEQQLDPDPGADYYARLSNVYEKYSAQVEKSVADAPTDAEQQRRTERARKLLAKAGDAAIALSRALTIADDKGHGDALWRGIDLYDRTGSMPQVIAALETFVDENPTDGQTPDALLRLGRAYQASGLFDKAIARFEHNQFRYPQSLAASKSGVPMAQCFVAKGPDFFPKAEAALLATIGSQFLSPEAEEFHDALFELARLYYRTNRFEEAVSRLEELTERYPTEDRKGQLQFLMADSYRKSSMLLKRGPGTQPVAPGAESNAGNTLANQAEAATARRERLARALQLYDRTIETFRESPPKSDLDKLYLKLAYFYKADCTYDSGSYDEAIRLYDDAALRYQDDPSALAAYVQIVNCYCDLGKKDQAKVAAERAKWLLRKMPPDAFQQGGYSMPKEYWDNWLKWTGGAGGF